MFELRPSQREDAHYLIDIDTKCFDYAWTPEEWREISKTCTGCIATWQGTPVGMCIFRRTDEGDVEIVKLAVKPAFRRQGIGRHLIFNCVLYARELMASRVLVIVPESRLDPRTESDLSGWLTRSGFRANSPLLRNCFCFYGQEEDGVLFSLPVPFE